MTESESTTTTEDSEIEEILCGDINKGSQVFFDTIYSKTTDDFMQALYDHKKADEGSIIFISTKPRPNLAKMLNYENFYLVCMDTQDIEKAKVSENAYISELKEIPNVIETIISKVPIRKTTLILEISSFITYYGMLSATEIVEFLLEVTKQKSLKFICLFYNNLHSPLTKNMFEWKFNSSVQMFHYDSDGKEYAVLHAKEFEGMKDPTRVLYLGELQQNP